MWAELTTINIGNVYNVGRTHHNQLRSVYNVGRPHHNQYLNIDLHPRKSLFFRADRFNIYDSFVFHFADYHVYRI